MADEIKVLLFDLGKVMVDFDHLRAASRISSFCSKTPREIYDMFFESPATIAFEAGRISPHDFYLEVKRMLGLEIGFDSFIPIWNDIFFLSAKNRAVFGLVNALRKSYRTAMLSNINILHYEYLKQNYPVFGAFDEVFLSFQLGRIKPDKELYETVALRLKAEPAQIFYTDDRQELVDSARALGFRGCVFKDFEQLVICLKDNGIRV